MRTWLFLGMVGEKVFIMDERRKQTKAYGRAQTEPASRLNQAIRGERGGEHEEGREERREEEAKKGSRSQETQEST